jgi:sulfopropanediol 3-dehydrogenase
MSKLLKKPRKTKALNASSHEAVSALVKDMIASVRDRGDDAVRELSLRFDNWTPDNFRLSAEDIERAISTVPKQVMEDIRVVQQNVRDFARHQLDSMSEFEVETMPGVFLGQKHIPIVKAGAYVPGGRHPMLASAHMTVVTPKVAGVPFVTACTPPNRGELPAVTIAGMHLAGADEIYILGGVQAVVAMAVGTETIGKVDLIAGPGNAYVAEAKRQLFGDVGIDLLAGPTEIVVIADGDADPFMVAVDLLSQAEHGPDSPAILISTDLRVAQEAIEHIGRLLPTMPTQEQARPAWDDYGAVYVVDSIDEAFELSDTIAGEHVEVLISEPRRALDSLRHYGALFLGPGTCVSYGDKVIGTNHTLPTRGSARYTGGLWVGKYLRTVTYQEVRNQESSVALGELCGRASRVEGFEGHARSGDLRAGTAGDWAPSST